MKELGRGKAPAFAETLRLASQAPRSQAPGRLQISKCPMTKSGAKRTHSRTLARGRKTPVCESNILCNYFLTEKRSVRGWGRRADCVGTRFRRRAERFGGLRVL